MSTLRSPRLPASVRRAPPLWAAAVAGAFLLAPAREVRKLNGPLAHSSQGDVGPDLVASPDGTWLAYTARVGQGPLELFSVRSDAATPPIRLSPPMVAGGNVIQTTVALSADGTRVVYLADQEIDDSVELFSVPIDGSAAPIQLNGPLASNQSHVIEFGITADGARVVYRAHQDSVDAVELYSAPVDGSAAPIKLNGPLVSGGDVLDVFFSPDGQSVVYLADQTTDGLWNLHGVPVDGSTGAVQLSEATSSSHQIGVPAITPDGAEVFFCASSSPPGILKLFRVPIDGGAPPLLLDPRWVDGPQVSPDGTRVVYAARTAQTWTLWSLPIEGGYRSSSTTRSRPAAPSQSAPSACGSARTGAPSSTSSTSWRTTSSSSSPCRPTAAAPRSS